MDFHHSQEIPLHSFPDQSGGGGAAAAPPNWLNSALLRPHHPPPPAAVADTNFLNLASAADNSTTPQSQWLPRSSSFLPSAASDAPDSIIPPASSGPAADLLNGGGSQIPENMKQSSESAAERCGGGGGEANWPESGRYKGEILNHPLYEQLLSAHVACLRIATPVDQLPRIDSQLAQSQNVVSKYSHLAAPPDDKELDQFMTHYFLLLCSFKEQLQQHVRVHAMEAVMACWEIEQSLQSLTGVSPGEGTGATMSDDDHDDPVVESEAALFDGSFDGGHDSMMGFGPLVPTETERSLMERVRLELKHELKQGYKEKIADIREEILRKRRAGKLPGDTTSVLKSWWQSHSKWPYPTVSIYRCISITRVDETTFNVGFALFIS
ncbi:Homeobox protein knotted-1-like 3 [Linum perenne]